MSIKNDRQLSLAAHTRAGRVSRILSSIDELLYNGARLKPADRKLLDQVDCDLERLAVWAERIHASISDRQP